MATSQVAPTAPAAESLKSQILKRYDDQTAYYWKMSKSNKNSFKATRYLMIVLGALVTLVSSLTAAHSAPAPWNNIFAVATPLLAASLAVVGGISQAFQWGAAWSDMVISATRLEKERDRISVTPADQIGAIKEMALLDDTVLAETQGFFQRLLGSGGPAKSEPKSTEG